MCINIAVLLSGNGSNLKAIIDKGIKVSFVASNNPKALGLKIAKECKYTYILLEKRLTARRRSIKINN